MDSGKAVRVALAKEGKSGTWLADRMGITRQQVSNLRWKPNAQVETLARVAVALDIPLTELIAMGE